MIGFSRVENNAQHETNCICTELNDDCVKKIKNYPSFSIVGPEKLKKFQAEKLMNSNKSISRKKNCCFELYVPGK